jgi:GTPase SAR1 family protein
MTLLSVEGTKKLTLDGRRVELAIWVSYIFIEKNSFQFFYLSGYSRTRTISSTWVLLLKIFFIEFYFIFSPLYYREANGAILVFDITDEDSFDRVNSPYRKNANFSFFSFQVKS